MFGVSVHHSFLLAAVAPFASAQLDLGAFTTRQHQVAGNVWALSTRVLEIRGFQFDGNAPAAFFWADSNSQPSSAGYVLQDASPSSSCGSSQLPGADGTQNWRVEFPEGTSLLDIPGGSISVWCEQFAANFGEIVLPASFDGLAETDETTLECTSQESTGGGSEVPIGSFTTRQHQVAGEVVAVSERVLEVRGFGFDGNAPAAFFWADTSATPSSNGFMLLDGAPSSSCGSSELPGADGTQDWRVEFPEGTSVLDVLGGSISVWCEQFSANFGEVVVPGVLEGVAATADGPALECSEQEGPSDPEVPAIAQTPEGWNCEPLNDDFQVRWKVENTNLNVQLVGLIGESEYMGFGISGDDASTNMVGADAVVADVFEGAFRARDFFMNTRAQCSNGDGVCPDVNGPGFTDDVSNVSGEEDSGVTLIGYTRPLVPTDQGAEVGGATVDRTIDTTTGVSTFIVWALGPVDPNTGLPFFHSIDFPREDVSLEFGRAVADNCSPLVGGATDAPTDPPDVEPFFIPPLTDVTEFTARIGPSGGDRGYMSITGRAAWGIAWYINDLLIPKIEMRRGTTYTFRINGGDDENSPSEFHPMYITTSIDGGYSQRTPEERAQETVFAGLEITEQTADAVTGFNVLASGPLCLYSTTDETEDAQDGSFFNYFASLDTSCANDTALAAAAGILEFTPDENTPDLLYYQCVTHRNLGWEINVVDADAVSGFQVDCSNLGESPQVLAEGLTLNAVIDPVENVLIAELTYEGEAWLAMGFTAGDAVMVGSEAVIGLPGEAQGLTNPGKYNLNERAVSGVNLMADEQQTLTNASITQEDGQTILKFTKLLEEPNEHPISTTESNTFLWAHGFDNNLAVHAARAGFEFLPAECRVFVNGVLQNEDRAGAPDSATGGGGGGNTDPEPFFIPPLTDVIEFTARIGPPGGDRGYSGITGREPFDVSWYINDLLIPEIEMRRGTTYTFRVNGGNLHPMYLTNSIVGGFAQLTPQERAEEIVVAGIEIIEQNEDGIQEFNPLASGPLCLYSVTDETEAALSGSYGEFFSSLDTSCAADAAISAEAAVLEFTPDETTPDLLYYQCVTHRNLGWKINVLNDVSGFQVDCSNLGESPQVLAEGLTLNAVIDPVENVLIAELTYEGEAWLAMGFTAGAAVMVGSEAVIGLPGEAQGLTNPGKYNLNDRAVSGVNLVPDEQQTLTNASIVQEDGQTILKFTKLLEEPNEHPISTTETNTFLWAYGSGNNLAVHAARAGFEFLPAECRVFVNGVLQNEERAGAPNAAGGGGGGNIRNLWVAHGVCASTAWGILVPLAVGSSLIRDVLERIGMPKGAWFSVHRALNMIAFLLTVVAFSIAVHIFNDTNRDHFTGKTHFTLGLVIFILTFCQALGGILRPHLPAPIEVKDEDGDQLVTPQKSVLRRTWEIFHRIVGVALLGMAWWQVQNGFGLFSFNFQADNIKNAFWGIVGGICGCFLILFVYQKFAMKKSK